MIWLAVMGNGTLCKDFWTHVSERSRMMNGDTDASVFNVYCKNPLNVDGFLNFFCQKENFSEFFFPPKQSPKNNEALKYLKTCLCRRTSLALTRTLFEINALQ